MLENTRGFPLKTALVSGNKVPMGRPPESTYAWLQWERVLGVGYWRPGRVSSLSFLLRHSSHHIKFTA